MGSGVKSYGENLVGRNVKVWWPKDKSFCEGVVSSHGNSGNNLVVCTNGVEEILDLKRNAREPGIGEGGPVYSSSHKLPEMDVVNDHGEVLVGCRVKVWRPKSNMFSEGVVASYDNLSKEHLVIYSDGVEEMMNLSNHKEPADCVSPDQTQNAKAKKARNSSSMHADNDMDTNGHAGKRHKGLPFNHTTPSASPIFSKDLKKPKLESDLEPLDSKLPSEPGDNRLVNINGYKIKSTSAETLEAIFAKYGDIMALCVCKSKFVRASLLEVICNIVQRLQYHDVDAILSQLEDIENEVTDLEASGIKVSWLHEHLAKLHRIVGYKEGSFGLRKTKAKSSFVTKAVGKELKQRHAELVLARERFQEAEKRVNAMRLVGRKIDDEIMEFESEEFFWKRRLDDLV